MANRFKKAEAVIRHVEYCGDETHDRYRQTLCKECLTNMLAECFANRPHVLLSDGAGQWFLVPEQERDAFGEWLCKMDEPTFDPKRYDKYRIAGLHTLRIMVYEVKKGDAPT